MRVAYEFEKIEVSKWRRRFDIYASSSSSTTFSLEDHPKEYAIVTRSSDDTQGKSFLTRLYFSRLGLAADVQRVLSSKHRTLYIGPIPEIWLTYVCIIRNNARDVSGNFDAKIRNADEMFQNNIGV